MTQPLLIVGSYLSPYVRKVLVILEMKGVAYRVDPIVPFFGDQEFTRLSPLRQVPVLVDGDLVLNDSSVICQYLEERYPEPRLYPQDIAQRARARWLEEYADSRLGQVIIWQLFNQQVIGRAVWGREPDPEVLRRTLEEDLPEVCGYLESQLPEHGRPFGEPSVGEIALACFFRNAQFARWRIDAQRWPHLAALVDAVLAEPAFVRLAAYEAVAVRTPIAEQRAALLAAGAPLSEHSLFRAEPVAGPMSRR